MDSDGEGRLSFSDLQFSSDDLKVDSKVISADGNHNPISSSSSSFNHDFLGFFSEEWSGITTSISPITPEGLIFCGKVIHTSRNNQNPIPNNPNESEKNNKSDLARWNSDSFCKCSNTHSSSGRKKDDHNKNEVLVQRTSKLACPSKSKWQVFMFGLGMFPRKMELGDIRSRQLRRSSSNTFPCHHGCEEEKSGGKRLPGLIRVLGCGVGFNKNDDMIKSSKAASRCIA